jgi:hypothetical protein
VKREGGQADNKPSTPITPLEILLFRRSNFSRPASQSLDTFKRRGENLLSIMQGHGYVAVDHNLPIATLVKGTDKLPNPTLIKLATLVLL